MQRREERANGIRNPDDEKQPKREREKNPGKL